MQRKFSANTIIVGKLNDITEFRKLSRCKKEAITIQKPAENRKCDTLFSNMAGWPDDPANLKIIELGDSLEVFLKLTKNEYKRIKHYERACNVDLFWYPEGISDLLKAMFQTLADQYDVDIQRKETESAAIRPQRKKTLFYPRYFY